MIGTTDRQRDRQTDRQTDRQRKKEGQIGRWNEVDKE